jgi:hypothetical protein
MYGQSAGCSIAAATASGSVPVSARLGGLAAATRYHYRIVVTTAGGTVQGRDLTFRTPALPVVGAPLVGLVLQRVSSPAGYIGRLLGIQGIRHAVVGEALRLRCVHGCARRTLLSISRLNQRLMRRRVGLGRPLLLGGATHVEIDVSQRGHLGRYARYAFAPGAGTVSVRLIGTGCLAAGDRAVRCPPGT